MDAADPDALLDRLVASYADRVAAGRIGDTADLLAQVAPEQREALARCLRTVELGVAPGPSPKPLLPGSELGGCRILATLGRGGVATVYRAEQRALHREVALKVLRPGLAFDPRQAERFRREGLAVARLEHPNLIRIHDVGAQDGHLFLVMEKIDGKDLAQALRELPEPKERSGAAFLRALRSDGGASVVAAGGAVASFERAVAGFFAVVARAVAAAHERGVIHRDLKPSNVLLRRDGTPVVADFGLAKGDGDLAWTLTGEPLGTPYYMSPEQIEQAVPAIDGRTDVYSLGVTLYEVLAGRRPFQGDTAIQVFDAIRRTFAPSLRLLNPAITRSMEAVVARAMARAADERYASAAELAADLEAVARGLEPMALRGFRPRSRLAAMLDNVKAGGSFEYRSPRTLLGLPLVHVAFGRTLVGYRSMRGTTVLGIGWMKRGRWSRAKGWIAIGDFACGGLAIGTGALGLVAVGAGSVGLVALGGFALGGLALAGVATGVVAYGGVAAGLFAAGGLALGWSAVGGCAIGHFAAGGKALGDFVLSPSRQDVEAARHFDGPAHFLLRWCVPALQPLVDRALGR